MMRALTFLFGMLLGACTAHQPATSAPASPPSHVEPSELRARTVALVMRTFDEQTVPFCTGVWVSPTAILTAHHCVSAHLSERLSYVTEADALAPTGPMRLLAAPRFRAAFVAAIDPSHDLALLRAVSPPAGHAIARTALGTIEQGSQAYAMGHSMRLWYSFSRGDVSAVRMVDAEGDDEIDPLTVWVQTTTPMSMGNSGGGLFDSHAQLLGIAHAFVDHGQNLNLYVEKRHIDTFLTAQGSTL